MHGTHPFRLTVLFLKLCCPLLLFLRFRGGVAEIVGMPGGPGTPVTPLRGGTGDVTRTLTPPFSLPFLIQIKAFFLQCFPL